jgi:hypothetical protein
VGVVGNLLWSGTTGFSEKNLEDMMEFADMSTMGAIVSPSFSIGLAMVQQAAQNATFHYTNVEVRVSCVVVSSCRRAVEWRRGAAACICLSRAYLEFSSCPRGHLVPRELRRFSQTNIIYAKGRLHLLAFNNPTLRLAKAGPLRVYLLLTHRMHRICIA